MEQAILHLKKDPILARIVKVHRLSPWKYERKLYEALLSAIVGQQLSVKAADTIWKRVETLLNNDFSPENILKTPDEKLREAGMSWAKIKYVKGIAEAFKDNLIDEEKIINLSDEEIIEELTKLKGVGRWTAEMILIFTLGREDVFSMGDLGLRNAVSKLYGVDRDDMKKIEEITVKWRPYRSLASRLLWMFLDNALVSKNKSSKSKSQNKT